MYKLLIGLYLILYFIGYILSAIFALIGVYFLWFKKSSSKSAALMCVVVSVLAFSLQFGYFRSQDPDYKQQQQAAQQRDFQKKLAQQLDFPVYSLRNVVSGSASQMAQSEQPASDPQNLQQQSQHAEVVSRFKTQYALLVTRDPSAKRIMTLYQYKPGTIPYTIRVLSGATCQGAKNCQEVATSKIGTVYEVKVQNNAQKFYFVSSGKTNLFLSFSKPTDVPSVVNLVDALTITPADKLPF